ncbi:TetR/AcrR family transcriptional regulator [Lacrimispora sp.]|uniref:TetR/AcrR family transcriptional regulator n=1 Tax=Lacrimispora sp. TaxID=2719234 RepID=UPI0028B0A473|nr:TetR/AcrR family transcriptional regulator [Lacrimispora sp.]
MARITKSVEERRKEIIDTAKALFMEFGFDKTQISDIAKSMNVAQGLVYHYFKSKSEMFYAVIDEMAEEKRGEIELAMHGNEKTALERLYKLLGIKMQSDNFGKLITGISDDAAMIEYCTNKMTEAALQILITLIKQGNEDGSWNCAYPEESALFIIRGFSVFFNITGLEDKKEEKEQTFLYIILRVLGATIS